MNLNWRPFYNQCVIYWQLFWLKSKLNACHRPSTPIMGRVSPLPGWLQGTLLCCQLAMWSLGSPVPYLELGFIICKLGALERTVLMGNVYWAPTVSRILNSQAPVVTHYMCSKHTCWLVCGNSFSPNNNPILRCCFCYLHFIEKETKTQWNLPKE